MSARLALVFVFLAALAGGAAAQQPDALVRASTLFAEAQTLYLAKNFDGAAEGFKKAYEARPQAQFLYNTAAAYHMKGKKTGDVAAYELAVQYYQKYVGADPAATSSAAAAASSVPSHTPTSMSAYGPSRRSTDTIATCGASNSAKLRSHAS